MKVVIAGAGFAGLTLAQRLPRRMEVTVLDPAPRFGFLPNIHELVSGVKRPTDLELDRDALISRSGGRYVPDSVVEVRRRRREVLTAGGLRLPYDQLVVAVGGEDHFHGVDGAEDHAMSFKTVAHCALIGRRLRQLLSDAPEPGGAQRSVVIVGGGLEGVECLGEVLRRHRHRPDLRIHLVEAGHRLLPGTPTALDRSLRARCATLPITLHFGARVRRVTKDSVELAGGARLRSDATIWTGGLQPSPLVAQANLAGSETAWGAVDSSLRALQDTRLWIAGDASGLPTALPKQAYHAMQMGTHLAANLARIRRGRRPTEFRPQPKPMLISFGDLDTFLVTERLVLAGTSIAALKEGVFQVGMAQLQRLAGGRLIPALGRRVGQATRALLLPQLGSTAAWRRLPDVRVLSD